MTQVIAIALYDSLGNPLTGSDAPTIVQYRDRAGSSRTPPTGGFSHALTSSLWWALATTEDVEEGTAYLLDCGVSSSFRYAAGAVCASGNLVAFAIYDALGVPLTGATPTIREYKSQSVLRNAPTPLTFGGGLYGFVPSQQDLEDGVQYDIVTGAYPDYVSGLVELQGEAGGGGPSTAPVVSNFVPATGSTIFVTSSISFDVTDVDSALRRVMVVSSFPLLDIMEVVHNGDSFGYKYNASSLRTSISEGYHYEILRDGGWPDSPTITAYAIDVSGSENV